MLIDHLLSALGLEDDDKAVKAADNSAHLKAVDQKHGDRLPVAPCLVEKKILKILLLHLSALPLGAAEVGRLLCSADYTTTPHTIK